MYKLFYTLIISLGFTLTLQASNHTPMNSKQIKQMDRSYNKHKTIKRNFKNQKDFQRKQGNSYQNGKNYHPNAYYPQESIRQRGYPYSKRGWELAYRYDRASFYDNEGFYYGYFNRHGYEFEDRFYAYDRYYGYRDRVRGRGLFDHRYYIPMAKDYYGFNPRPRR
ncbi:MAG: hypothetical protein Q9M36_09815 [Sulfurovum sp.]|nr:hypothetical protein [Sulfurovum sp.]